MKWTEVEIMQTIADAGINVSAFDSTVDCFEVQLFDLVNAVVAAEREACAMSAWAHYMDTCRKRGVPPSSMEHWLAATSIRERTKQ